MSTARKVAANNRVKIQPAFMRALYGLVRQLFRVRCHFALDMDNWANPYSLGGPQAQVPWSPPDCVPSAPQSSVEMKVNGSFFH